MDNLEPTGPADADNPDAVEPQPGAAPAAAPPTDWQDRERRYKEQIEGSRLEFQRMRDEMNQYRSAIWELQQGRQAPQQAQREVVDDYATEAEAQALSDAALSGDHSKTTEILRRIGERAAKAGAKLGAEQAIETLTQRQQFQQKQVAALQWAQTPKYQTLFNNPAVNRRAQEIYLQAAANPAGYEGIDLGNGQAFYPALMREAADRASWELNYKPADSGFVDLASAAPSSSSRTVDPGSVEKPPEAYVKQMQGFGYEDPKEIARIWGNTEPHEREQYLK